MSTYLAYLAAALRLFCTEGGVASWLQGAGMALTDFFKWAQGLTERLRRRTEKIACDAGRPVQYLNGFVQAKNAEVLALLFLLGRWPVWADAGKNTDLVPVQCSRGVERSGVAGTRGARR